MAKAKPTPEELAAPEQAPAEEALVAPEQASAEEAPVARAPSLSREEIVAMGLDPAPYGYPSEDKAAE